MVRPDYNAQIGQGREVEIEKVHCLRNAHTVRRGDRLKTVSGVLQHALCIGIEIVRTDPGDRSSMISFAIGNEQDPIPFPQLKNFASGKYRYLLTAPMLPT